MDFGLAVLGILLSYLLGSIPSAYILVRVVRGVDIRKLGTGNSGALNVYQHLGPKAGAVVLLADIAKGAVAVFLPGWLGAPEWARFGGAFAVVAGHNWPVFLGFRGGKGAATIFGVGLGLAPLLALISFGVGVVPVVAIRHVVAGVALSFVLFNILTIVTGEPWDLVGVSLALTVGVVANYMGRSVIKKWGELRSRRGRAPVLHD